MRPGGARELPLARADDVGELEEVLGVLAAAFLDETLQQMLVAFAVKEPKVRQLFSGLSFKARTDLAYALGLIGDIAERPRRDSRGPQPVRAQGEGSLVRQAVHCQPLPPASEPQRDQLPRAIGHCRADALSVRHCGGRDCFDSSSPTRTPSAS